MTDTYEDYIRQWRNSIDESLRRPYGWLSLAGLYWLSPGDQSIGSAPTCDVPLPAPAPAELGVVSVQSGVVELRTAPGQMIRIDGELKDHARLMPDTSGEPTQVDLGPLRLILIERGELLGLRVWDSSQPARQNFPGRRWFPISDSAKVQARWSDDRAGSSLEFPNELGQRLQESIAGSLRFSINGNDAELAALPNDDGSLFVIFADATTGAETYGGGRYLVVPPPDGDQATIDFNQAYNPPCAFTPYATCTLPPAGNRLAFPIRSGELAPVEGTDRRNELQD